MNNKNLLARLALLSFSLLGLAAHAGDDRLDAAVRAAMRPVMQRDRIPGMAVAVSVDGHRQFFYEGVASRESGRKVGRDTLFEIGSLSKTFTATVGAYARERGALSFSDPASKHLPALAGSAFDTVSLLDLGTYTAGGLPLQFPDAVTDDAATIAFFRDWHPAFAPGTHRQYSNPSIGLFGALAARSLHQPFEQVERQLFAALGLQRTFLRVPPQRLADYAFGHAKDDRPVRVNPGPFAAEAYGVKTNAADLLRFVEANLGSVPLGPAWRSAITATHTGWYQVGDMVQGLGWEMYAWPVTREQLLAGNSGEMAWQPHAVTRFPAPRPPRADVLANKTGSTNGFGAYALFIPARRIGIVILANRNYPNADRVALAWSILEALDR